ncbi:MAG: insulinase family protein [Candidatus Aminicenantes bacterium]|nr:MAG: insulinase family protein [Candidatus Aminicenantes bacterium]
MAGILKKRFAVLRKTLFFALSLLFLLIPPAVRTQEQEKTFLPVTHFQLKNGLHVVLSEDYSFPLVSVVVGYNVGSINEQPGKTGIAYLLQNMMFQGSRNVSRMQHVSFINRVGGELSALTTQDKTLFYQRVPSNQLARVLWLESDRMKFLEINALKVEQIKEAIIEEIHQRKANDPYMESFLTFDQLLYLDPAYSHPVIGYETDIRNLTVEDVRDFYSTFYIPNNAVLCVVGNIDKKKTEVEIRKYFETLIKGEDILSLPPPKAPIKKRTAGPLQELLASAPGFHLGYRIASPMSDDFYPLKIIEYILLRGQTSLLYRRLFKREVIAIQLNGNIETRKNQATLRMFVINSNQLLVERSQKAIFSEINRLKSRLLPEKELRRAKNMFKIDYISQFATSLSKALFLNETFLSKRSLDGLSGELEKYLSVTPHDILRISKKYFTQENILLNIKIK